MFLKQGEAQSAQTAAVVPAVRRLFRPSRFLRIVSFSTAVFSVDLVNCLKIPWKSPCCMDKLYTLSLN